MLQAPRVVLVLLIGLALDSSAWHRNAFAAEEGVLSGIPEKPSAPGLRPRQVPEDVFQCARYYSLNGKRLDCDSNVRRDGEKLRPILEPVPEAIAALNQYQRNRRSLKTAAYVGTGGILIAAAGWLVARAFFSNPGTTEATSTGIVIRNMATLSGLSVSIGSVVYGLTLTRTNERNLGRAVDLYNAARPEQPIELQFTTGIAF